MEFLSSVIVVSLFTNIPIELAVKSIEKRWDKIKKAISILKNEFIGSCIFCFGFCILCFNNEYYQQNFGTPIGGISSFFNYCGSYSAGFKEVLDILGIALPFYIRYVDDVVMAAPIDSIEHFDCFQLISH